MEPRVLHFGEQNEASAGYRVRVAAFLHPAADLRRERTFWHRCLGIFTMVVVSAGGWAAIIELARWLR